MFGSYTIIGDADVGLTGSLHSVHFHFRLHFILSPSHLYLVFISSLPQFYFHLHFHSATSTVSLPSFYSSALFFYFYVHLHLHSTFILSLHLLCLHLLSVSSPFSLFLHLDFISTQSPTAIPLCFIYMYSIFTSTSPL